MFKKPALLSLSIILVLSVLVACKKEPTAQEIVTNAVAANAKLEALKFDLNLTMALEITGGTQAGKMNMSANATSLLDNAAKEMKMNMSMNLDVPGVGKQNAVIDTYFSGGWVYMKMPMPVVGQQWLKVEVTDEMWRQQNPVSQQLEFLNTATEISLPGTEKVDGIDSYIVKITPDIEELAKWLKSQQQISGLQNMDITKLDLAQMFKSFSIKEWITKDSYLFKKAEISLVFEMRPQDVGAPATAFEKMSLDVKATARFYDYNQRAPISLPPEALRAMELPTQNKP
ncbi:MAG: hypothetical protein HY665_01660 [Chloroflexi bacterium]|nr:hypothetical protein [Chloroflexota bacterium]